MVQAQINLYLGALGAAALDEGSDAQLLTRFLARRDQTAFASLLRRHGSMVLHVCRRVLRHPQDAEDAFQATFLLLARNAASIRKHDSVASWLYGVAYRLAVKARARNARRLETEKQAVATRPAENKLSAAWEELQAVLDEELHRLPANYQAPLALCYLEGKTHEEAARQLGWPLGTVRGRVARARELLRSRLARRGLVLPAAVLATVLAANVSRAVPAALMTATCKAAVEHAAGETVSAGLASAEAIALAEGGLATMTGTNLKVGLLLLLVVGVATAGAGTLATLRAAGDAPPAALTALPDPAAKAPDAKEDGKGLPEGAAARLGSPRFWAGGMNASGYSLTFTPDSKHVAMVGSDGGVHIWDVATGQEVANLGGKENTAPGRNTAMSVIFSKDGKLAATYSSGGSLRLWDVPQKKELGELPGEGGGIHGYEFSPDGKTLVAATRTGVLRWDVASRKALPALEGHKGPANGVAHSSDGKTIATGGDDQTIRLWDAESGKLKKTITGHRDRVISLAFGPGNKTLASRSSDNTLRIWDLESGKETRSLNHPSGTWTPGLGQTYIVAFSADGKSVIAGDYRGPRSYDLESGEAVKPLAGGLVDGSTAALSPDGKLLATGGFGQRIRVWDATTGKEFSRPVGHQGSVAVVAYSPDKKTIATGSRDRTVRLWDLATGQEKATLRGHSGSVSHLAFSPDGKHLATASGDMNDKTVSWWEVSTGKEVHQFPGHPGGIEAMTLSVDGKRLLVLAREGLLVEWDTESGKEVRQTKRDRTFNATFAPDRKTLVYQGGGQPPALQAVDVTNPEATPRGFEGQEPAGFGRVSFTADGTLMLTTSFDQTMQIWDLAARKAVRPVRRADAEPMGGGGAGGAVPVLSPDARIVAVPTRSGIAVVEVATGKDRAKFRAGQGTITALAFSPDGSKLVSGGEDGTALVWDVKAPAQAPKSDLSAKELDALWSALGDTDAAKADRAIRSLSASPRQAVPLLRKQLAPAADVDQKKIDALVADLSSNDFATRKKAEEELAKLGQRAKPALTKALAAKPSLDATQRIEGLLKGMEDRDLPADDVRVLRAVEVLEAIGTDESRKLLQEWAGGAGGVLLTEEAKASLARTKGGKP